jgi:RNA polymerase sigma-70 factor (ECF subfamily)
MSDLEAEQFEQYRPLMFSIAYRMLGSAADAQDIVQDAYLRYQTTPADQIASPKAFLATIVTRLCLDQMKSAWPKRSSAACTPRGPTSRTAC